MNGKPLLYVPVLSLYDLQDVVFIAVFCLTSSLHLPLQLQTVSVLNRFDCLKTIIILNWRRLSVKSFIEEFKTALKKNYSGGLTKNIET